MRAFALFGCLLAGTILEGCAAQLALYDSPVRPPYGFLYSHYTVPLTTDFHNTPVRAPKTGRAKTIFISIPLYFTRLDFAFEDASIRKAAASADISHVYYAEAEFQQVLGALGLCETVVYGR